MTEEKIEKILNQIDNYDQTVLALISFSHIVIWDDEKKDFRPNSFRLIARKMDTSDVNPISPNKTITPDLVIQRENNYGIVGEVKKNFPQDRSLWLKNFKQIQKYDDKLKGWKTPDEFIQTSDIILLTHNKFRVDLSDYISSELDKKTIQYQNNFSIIGFQRVEERKVFFSFEKGYGELSNLELNDRLRRIVQVPLDRILPFSSIKFYDDRPKTPYTMSILWMDIFPQYVEIDDFMEAGGKKIIEIQVDVEDLTERLRTQFSDFIPTDARQPVVPKNSWVKEALEMYVKTNHATRLQSNQNLYIIKYKNLKHPLETFTREMVEGTVTTLDAHFPIKKKD